MNIENLTIAHLHSQYKNGHLTPSDLIQSLLEKSKQYDHKNIWIRQLTAAEIASYINALDMNNIENQPLWGIPFVIKDNIDLAGIPTTAACEAFSYIPEKNAFVVDQLLEAGAIPLGKANMDQFATGLVGVRSPKKWGTCKNAFNDDYISGGSSSGSAVAVALGLATFSLGTDTAGSGRVPAALNNIIGLKPSKGLISCDGVVPACKSLDCVSIFATTTDDANIVFETAASFDSNDAYARKNIDTNNKNYGRYSQPFSFAVPQPEQLKFFGNASAEKLFQQSVSQLEAIGGIKHTLDFSPFLDAAQLLYSGPWVVERYLATETIYNDNPNALLPVIKTIIGSQTHANAADTFTAFYQLQHYKQQADQLFSNIDLLVTPTAGTIYTQQQLKEDPIQLNSNMGYYTNYMNLLDYSGIAIPAGFQDNQLPFGITLVGKAFDDTKLLAIANQWQAANDNTIGATNSPVPAPIDKQHGSMSTIDVVVCGAHLEGLPLNCQLQDRDAQLITKTQTSANYRLYALTGGPPFRPGLIRDESQGAHIEVEVWRLPSAFFGSFVVGIPQPLGIGKVELDDGTWLPSFICEGHALASAEEITQFGGWRSYMKSLGK